MTENPEFKKSRLDDEDLILDPEGALLVGAVGRFTKLARRIHWFLAVGLPVEDDLERDARTYLDAMGFVDAGVALVENWEDAAEAAASMDWNTPWWEAEEQLVASLSAEAVARHGDAELAMAMDHLRARIGEDTLMAAAEAARSGGIDDEALVNAAAGAAVQACYQAALVILTQSGEDHPFALRFRLFEAGRWPIGVTGASFNLF
ncbi:MAG: hypothetical protein WEB93_02570 [Sphingomonadales bacterium]